MARPYGSRDTAERGYVPPVKDKKRHGLVRLSPLVPADVHKQAYDNAKAAGVSMSLYLAELIRRDELDESGAPVWAADALPGAKAGQKELPLTG
ncbi:hypothetical protein ACWCQL_13210 [Streptomyces sp. NPDC002073]